MRSYDLSHVPLLVLCLLPLAAAVVVAVVAGADGPLDLEHPGDLTALVAVIALVALSSVVEVVGHERVGYPHTPARPRTGPHGVARPRARTPVARQLSRCGRGVEGVRRGPEMTPPVEVVHPPARHRGSRARQFTGWPSRTALPAHLRPPLPDVAVDDVGAGRRCPADRAALEVVATVRGRPAYRTRPRSGTPSTPPSLRRRTQASADVAVAPRSARPAVHGRVEARPEVAAPAAWRVRVRLRAAGALVLRLAEEPARAAQGHPLVVDRAHAFAASRPRAPGSDAPEVRPGPRTSCDVQSGTPSPSS